MTPRGRFTRWITGLVLVVFALTGCVTVPTSGPVVHHDLQRGSDEAGVEIAPEPPAPGAGPQLIVEGFLHAMATYQPGYGAARQYLTSRAAAAWHPESGISVYAEGTPVSGQGASIELRSTLVGTVDSQWRYTQRDTGFVHDFGLVDEGGQWRISQPPAGILVSEYLFQNAYMTANAFYLDASSQTVVPDPVIVPRGMRDLTPLVGRLLNGPSRWLEPVIAPIPGAASVKVESVATDESGVAVTTLTSAANGLDPSARSELAAQIVWTLAQFDGVSGVRLEVDGQPLAVDGASAQGVLTPSDLMRFAPVSDTVSQQLYGVAGDTIVHASTDGGRLETSPAGLNARPSGFAVDASAHAGVAVVEGNRLIAGRIGDDPAPLFTTPGLLRPQFSRGELWAMTIEGNLFVWRDATVQPNALAVEAATLAGRRIRAFRISPDGSRLAAVTMDGTVGLLRIVRTPDSIEVSGWTEIEVGPRRPLTDVGWAGISQLALSYAMGSSGGVLTSDLSGAFVTDQNLVNGKPGLLIAASTRVNGADLIVCDPEGECHRRTGEQQWTALSGVLTHPVFPS
jgi:hypothetical protein